MANMNYNVEDYNNALNVLRKCNKWVIDTISKYSSNSDFPDRVKLVLISEFESPYHRGHVKEFLVFTKYGLSTCQYCGDGSSWEHEIKMCDTPYKYAYNNDYQKTIDIAAFIANRWDDIKNTINSEIGHYLNFKSEKSKLLSSFEV